jgi:hypothetical protein
MNMRKMRPRWKILCGVILVIVTLALVAVAYVNLHDPLVQTRATSVAATDADLMGMMQGYWQDANRGLVIGFEGQWCCYTGNLGMYRTAEDSTIQFCYAFYRKGRLNLQTWSPFLSREGAIVGTGTNLTFTFGDVTFQLQRIGTKPPALDVTPYDLPLATELTSEKKKAIKGEIGRRFGLEQGVRKELVVKSRTAHLSPANQQRLMEEMNAGDAEHAAYVRTMIQQVGWIDASRFGKECTEQTMMLVQKSGDLRLMLTALPFLESDAKAGRIDGQSFCMLYDRAQTYLNRPQRYGSQVVGTSSGGFIPEKMYLYPVEDMENVDRLRNNMGLPRLKVYLNLLSVIYGMKDIYTMDQLINAEPTSAGDVATRAASEK